MCWLCNVEPCWCSLCYTEPEHLELSPILLAVLIWINMWCSLGILFHIGITATSVAHRGNVHLSLVLESYAIHRANYLGIG